MERYFATCGRGIEPVLADELRALGAAGVEPGRGGVSFQGDRAFLYRTNLWLRTAIRVLRPILETTVASPDELYEAVQGVDWSRYLTPDHTLAVDCNVRDSQITHSKYAALRTIYFSDQSTKALNYAYGYWGGGAVDTNCFMFLVDVAMGRCYVPKGPSQDLPKPGYDSTFAKAGESGVVNNEMIVYQTFQINPRFLVEFGPSKN